MKMLNKNFIYQFLFLLATVSVVSCSKENSESTQAADENTEESTTVTLDVRQMKIAGIGLGTVEQKQISSTIKANGVLDVPPQQLVSVSAPLGGFLKNTDLLEGSRVKKGQVIATIENLEFIQMQQDYIEAKTNFELASSDYNRQVELDKQNVNSDKRLQQSKASYESLRAKFNGIKAKLKVLNVDPVSIEKGEFTSTIRLYSPIDGYVTQVNVNIGKFVSPADVLFKIVDTEHLHAELTVFEKDVPKLRIGQKVRFTLANENKERLATVYLIGREISADRTIRIHCHIDKEDKELLPGMYLMAIVETGGALVPALPDDAVLDYQGAKYIFIVLEKAKEPNQRTDMPLEFQMMEIQAGNSESGFTEVTLPENFDLQNARVVVQGAYFLLSKLKNNDEEAVE
jgi:cobalt-zinc-cadmium efflux system membrane fusion protein